MSPECVTSCRTGGSCWTTCRSGSATGPRSRSSAPTAPARPRCCASSPATSMPHAGVVTRTGGLGVMRQIVGTDRGDDPTVADLLLSVSPRAGPRGRGRRGALRARADGDRRRDDPARATPRRCRSSPTPAATTSRWSGTSARPRRSALPYDQAKYRSLSTLSRRRAEAARAGVPARGSRRGAAARRAGQLPRRAGQDLAGGADPRVAPRRSCSSATTASCSTTRRRGSSPSSSGADGNRVWTHPGGFASLPRGTPRPVRALRGAAPPLGRGARRSSRPSCSP